MVHYRYKLLIALLVLLPLLIVLPPLLWPQDNRRMYEETLGTLPAGLQLAGAYSEGAFRERVQLFILKPQGDGEIAEKALADLGELKPATPDDVAYGVSLFPDIIPRQWKKLQLYVLTPTAKKSGYIHIIYDKEKKTIYLITIST